MQVKINSSNRRSQYLKNLGRPQTKVKNIGEQNLKHDNNMEKLKIFKGKMSKAIQNVQIICRIFNN